MKFQVDAQILGKLSRIFHCGTYQVAFDAKTNPDYITVSGFDGIKFMQGTFYTGVYEEGEVILPSKYLNTLSTLEGPVTISYLKDLVVKDSNRSFHLPLAIPDGPYLMPEIKPVGAITVKLEEMKRLIKRVRFASGTDESCAFDRVLLEFGDFIRAVGCDRRTVAVARTPQGSPYKGQFQLPKEGLEVISKLEGDMATLTIYRTGIRISVDGEVMFGIYVPERAGKFPHYCDLLKVSVNTTMHASRDDLMSVLADMRLVSDEVSIAFSYNSYVKLRPKFRARDENNAVVERFLRSGNWQGRDFKIKVNAKTLMNAIENISGVVTFKFTNELGPFLVVSEDENFMAALLPYSIAERK